MDRRFFLGCAATYTARHFLFTNHQFILVKYAEAVPWNGMGAHIYIRNDNPLDAFVSWNTRRDDLYIKESNNILVYHLPVAPISEDSNMAKNQMKFEILEHIGPGQYVAPLLEHQQLEILLCISAEREYV